LKTILTAAQLSITCQRLAHQILEQHPSLENTVLIGLQPRGVFFSNRIVEVLKSIATGPVMYGQLDITFYRDDIRKGLHVANTTNLPFDIENRKVIIVSQKVKVNWQENEGLDEVILLDN